MYSVYSPTCTVHVRVTCVVVLKLFMVFITTGSILIVHVAERLKNGGDLHLRKISTSACITSGLSGISSIFMDTI